MKYLLDITDSDLFDTDHPAYGVTIEALLSLREVNAEDLKAGKN